MAQSHDPPDCVILSDLHLAEGRNPVSKLTSRLENFFHDHTFERMLLHLEARAREKGRPWILIFNGDFIDFHRTTSIPEPHLRPKDFPSPTPTKLKYGLGTSPAESKWQLEQVVAGHPTFFRALARFVLSGNRVIIIKGNHDINWFWPEVRYRFFELIEEHLHKLCTEDRDKTNRISLALNRIQFNSWFFYIRHLIYVEHGNQYDPNNSFRHFLYPVLMDPDSPVDRYELDLPFGAFFVRYFFNKIELEHPMAPNYHNSSTYFYSLWRRHFYASWQVARNYFPYLVRTLRKVTTRRGPRYREIKGHQRRFIEKIGKEYNNEEAVMQLAALQELPPYDNKFEFMSHILEPVIRKVTQAAGGILVLSFLWSLLSQWLMHANINILFRTTLSLLLSYGFILSGLVWILAILRPTKEGTAPSYREAEPSELRKKAAAAARIMGVKYVTFGHSHVEDIFRFPEGDAWYFNTGTWTPHIDEERQVVRPEVHFPLLMLERGEANLMRWNDSVGEFEELPILEEKKT